MLAEVLNKVVNVVSRKSRQKKESTWDTKVPMCYSDIQKCNCCGHYALIQKKSRPGVTMVGERAYVLLSDCITDLLGHGFKVDNITHVVSEKPITKISQT